jgi:hypothetical protein
MEDSMANLGMILLGVFVGGVLSLGFPTTTNLSVADFTKVVGVVLVSAFTGPVFTYIGYLGGSTTLGDALLVYPVGLTLAGLWFFVRLSILNLAPETPKSVKLLAWLHISAITVITLVVAFIFGLPVVIQAAKQMFG